MSSFDPTSSSSKTAACILCAAMLCVACSSYNFAKYKDNKAQILYQLSMLSIGAGVMMFFCALYIFWAYD